MTDRFNGHLEILSRDEDRSSVAEDVDGGIVIKLSNLEEFQRCPVNCQLKRVQETARVKSHSRIYQIMLYWLSWARRAV